MNTFSMKQWLVENKVGPYSKIHENEDQWSNDFEKALYSLEMEPWKRTMIIKAYESHAGADVLNQYGDMDPVTAAQTFADDLIGKEKEDFSKWAHLDKTMDGWPLDEEADQDHVQYDDDDESHMYFASEKPDQAQYNIQRSNDGKIVSATNQEGTTFKRGDTAKLAPQDGGTVITINNFIEQQGKVKALYSVRGTPYTYDIDGLDSVNPRTNEQMGVGYVMKTKLSDPKY